LLHAGRAASTEAFEVYHNYVALPLKEAFGIEYWALEEAKLRRQPPEQELSRKVAFVVGAGHGIGREVAVMAAKRGAHVVAVDIDGEAAKAVAGEVSELAGKDAATSVVVDIRDRNSVRTALRRAIETFGGVDILVNTAAIFPASPDGTITDEQWRLTLDINVTGNHLLASEAERIYSAQNLSGSIVLTSSANAVVPKRGSEAYDVSKAALSHLVRELAISLAPTVRVNGISPATVVKGSTMFPRDRVLASLAKYKIEHNPEASTDELRNKLAHFYAQRTLTHEPIDPFDCAEAILFPASDRSRCTTGHLFPVDGRLTEAFLR
jgi:NAD(P)-dependent dehydrogenase (short-subunit alcohol dehydrogenase family)